MSEHITESERREAQRIAIETLKHVAKVHRNSTKPEQVKNAIDAAIELRYATNKDQRI